MRFTITVPTFYFNKPHRNCKAPDCFFRLLNTHDETEVVRPSCFHNRFFPETFKPFSFFSVPGNEYKVQIQKPSVRPQGPK